MASISDDAASRRVPASPSGFMPKDLVTVTVGKVQAQLYPKLQPDWLVHERAHSLHINRTALQNLPGVDMRLKYDAFGAQLNCSATVAGALQDWKDFFATSWFDFSSLIIESFHNSSGTVLGHTTVQGNPRVLLPVVNGDPALCRSPDVKFVRVQLVLDFRPLVTLDPPGVTTLRQSYYIELPQSTATIQDADGNDFNLTTFHGVADLSTLPSDEIKTEILDLTLQTGPITLGSPEFNLHEAVVDDCAAMKLVDNKILKLAWAQVCRHCFDELCPGYSNQPHAAIEHIRQNYVDSAGQSVTMPVLQYYQSLQNAALPFYPDPSWPVSVCNHFIEYLDPRLAAAFRKNYPDYSVQHRLDGRFQRRQLPIIYRAAHLAEEEVSQIMSLSRQAVGQSFHTNVAGDSPLGPFPAFPAAAFPSQAERTLGHYGPSSGDERSRGSMGSSGSRRPIECFGCGGPHPWRNKLGVITCPDKDKPGVKETAESRYQEFVERLKRKRIRNNKRTARKLAAHMTTDMLRPVPAHVPESPETPSVASSLTNPASSHGAGRGALRRAQQDRAPGPLVLVVDVTVFASGTPMRKLLPVPIQTNFPHVCLPLGPERDESSGLMMRALVDTAAAVSTGNFYYISTVAKAYPAALSRIYAPEDYSGIVLSGIVESGGAAVTTELTVGFEFHLPWKTKDGHSTSLLIATGKHVTVNVILGLPFIQATGMVIDAADSVAELRALDSPPLPIEFRRAALHVPHLGESDSATVSHAHAAVVRDIEKLEEWMNTDVGSTASNDHLPARRVAFGSAIPRSTGSGSSLTSSNSSDRCVTSPGSINPVTLASDALDDYHDPMMGIAQPLPA